MLRLSTSKNARVGWTLAATAAGLLGALSVAGRVTLTVLARRVGLARAAALIVGGQVAAIGALLVAPGTAGLVVFVLGFGLGFGVMTIARALLLADFADASLYGRLAGRQAVATTAAKVAAPAVAAAAYASRGTYLLVFVTVGLCSAVAVWALLCRAPIS